MKRNKLLATFSLGTLLAGLAAFTACGETGNSSTSAKEKDCKVTYSTSSLVLFTATTDVMEIAPSTSMYDYMVELQKLKQMTFEGSESDYGFTVTSVNGTATDFTVGNYWSVYIGFTTLEGDQTIYANEQGSEYDGVVYGAPIVIDGETYYSANYGVSGIPVVEGEAYCLKLVG